MAEYSFGRLVIDGREYRRDVIILPDAVIDNWWREEGHKLSLKDLQQVVAAGVEVLVVGTGAYGLMKVPDQVREKLLDKNIEVIVEPTGKAVKTFERLRSAGCKVAGAFHLTC